MFGVLDFFQIIFIGINFLMYICYLYYDFDICITRFKINVQINDRRVRDGGLI